MLMQFENRNDKEPPLYDQVACPDNKQPPRYDDNRENEMRQLLLENLRA